MTKHQSDESHNPDIGKMNTKSFANFWVGMFFLTSSASLFILMLMFIFVWQPIWTEGFKDFHTISNAIDKLDKTAEPASASIPLMLAEMNNMNKNMHAMKTIMQDMSDSIGHMEEMTPEIKKMARSIEQMTLVLSTEIPRMSHIMGRLHNKMPNMDFMPFK